MDPMLFLADLEAKPAALHALASTMDSDEPWSGVDGQRILMLGMGSSRYAAEVAAQRMRAVGWSAVAEYASAPTTYRADVVIAISASGTSRETLDAAARYPGYIALTNAPDSPLARSAAAVVDLAAGVEAGGVACRTFQHTLLRLLELVEYLNSGQPMVADLARAAARATQDLLDRRAAWLPAVADLLDGPHGVYALAPALRLSSAQQAALMFREGPRRPATGCETGDWSHVDVYLTKTLSYRALLYPGSPYDDQALEWLRQRGATVVSVGAKVAGAAGAAATVRYAGDDDPDVRLVTETLVAELVAARWWLEAAETRH